MFFAMLGKKAWSLAAFQGVMLSFGELKSKHGMYRGQMMIASEIGTRSAVNAVLAAAVLFRRGQFIEVDRRYASIYDSLRRLAYEASADLEHGYKISQTTQSMDVWAAFPTMDRARFFGGLEP